MNVYEMYVANGNSAGFLVKRKNWRSPVRVVSIGGQSSGPLVGTPPYYGNPVVLIYGGKVLSCPGTFQYELVSG